MQAATGPCGHAALTHPAYPALLPSPTPPSTLLARPRRLTDSAADRAGPFHLAAAAAAGLAGLGWAVQHKVTKSQSHGGRRSRQSVSLAWPGMASHAQNWAPISPTLPIPFCMSCDLAAPFLLCCSALLCSCSVLLVRTYRTFHRGRPVCLPSPRPFLNYTFCIAHAILSDPVGKTEPNPTQLNPLAHIRTLIPSRLAVHTLRGVREHFDLPCFACCAPLSRIFFLSYYLLALPTPPLIL